jgi:hypothetical protein
MASGTLQKRSFDSPDETRTFPKGKAEVLNVNGRSVMLSTFEPGFVWSECLKPQLGTELCEADHLMYIVSGRIRIRMADGTEEEFGQGDIAQVPPGHDGWTVGDEPVVFYDIGGAQTFAK